jgi:hypothetical protein
MSDAETATTSMVATLFFSVNLERARVLINTHGYFVQRFWRREASIVLNMKLFACWGRTICYA